MQFKVLFLGAFVYANFSQAADEIEFTELPFVECKPVKSPDAPNVEIKAGIDEKKNRLLKINLSYPKDPKEGFVIKSSEATIKQIAAGNLRTFVLEGKAPAAKARYLVMIANPIDKYDDQVANSVILDYGKVTALLACNVYEN